MCVCVCRARGLLCGISPQVVRLLQEMTLEGAHTRTIGSGDLVLGSGARSDPIDGFVWGIAANAAVVVVGTMSETKRVTMFELSGGFPVLSFGVKGVKEGELDGVSGIRFTRDGSHLLIAEDYGHRVSLFTLKGTFVRCIGVGTLRSPSDVCPTWTRSGDIAVADRDNHCIRVYSADGSRLLQTFGRWGRGPGELMCPTALATHGKQLFVLSLNSASVQVFE